MHTVIHVHLYFSIIAGFQEVDLWDTGCTPFHIWCYNIDLLKSTWTQYVLQLICVCSQYYSFHHAFIHIILSIKENKSVLFIILKSLYFKTPTSIHLRCMVASVKKKNAIRWSRLSHGYFMEESWLCFASSWLLASTNLWYCIHVYLHMESK